MLKMLRLKSNNNLQSGNLGDFKNIVPLRPVQKQKDKERKAQSSAGNWSFITSQMVPHKKTSICYTHGMQKVHPSTVRINITVSSLRQPLYMNDFI